MADALPSTLNYRNLAPFPTTVLACELVDAHTLNRDLMSWIQRPHQHQPGVQRSNAGGWHSDKTLADDPAATAFLTLARDALSQWAWHCFDLSQPPASAHWQIELWANLNRRGHYNHAHDHFRSGIIASAFYYVQCGDANAGGRTVFLNQQSVPAFVQLTTPWRDREYAITPQAGTLVVFPSWLGHRVEPYLGDGDRITLALNAGHPELPVKRKGDRPLPPWLKRLLGR
ncbi:MAG: putative 2OG-Fe(II) oxygenase [Pseudomonadota bacterium]